MSIKTILELYKKYEVPENIVRHMLKVTAICLLLSDRMNSFVGRKIVDQDSLLTAGLLHDVLKLKSNEHESEMASLLEKMGQQKTAKLVHKHRFASPIDIEENQPESMEEKILYYADKRVKHDEIVSIKERIEDGRKRYKMDTPSHLKNEQAIVKKLVEYEMEIGAFAHLTPSEINEHSITPYLQLLHKKFQES